MNHRQFNSSYRRYVFDAKYQNGHIGSRQIQLNFYFSYAVVDVICHALVLSRKVISVKSVPINDNSIIVQKGLNKKNNIYFSYYERKTFYKNVPNAKNFSFDLALESIMERPKYIIIGFENKKDNEQTHDASTYDIMNVPECFCKIGSEFYPEDRLNINNGTDIYEEAFK